MYAHGNIRVGVRSNVSRHLSTMYQTMVRTHANVERYAFANSTCVGRLAGSKQLFREQKLRQALDYTIFPSPATVVLMSQDVDLLFSQDGE